MRTTAFLPMLIFCLASCGLYRQNAVNVPMLRQKGQVNVGVQLHANGLEGQVAAAASRSIGLMMNYSNLGILNKRADAEYTEYHAQHFGEFGFGLFRDKQKSAEKIRELFVLGGYGRSSIYREGLSGGHQEKVSYVRIGVQADLGREPGNFSYAFSPSLQLLHFKKLGDTDNLIPHNIVPTFVLAQVAFSGSYLLFKPISLFGQCTLSLPLTTYPLIQKYNRYADFSPFNFGAGIRFRFR